MSDRDDHLTDIELRHRKAGEAEGATDSAGLSVNVDLQEIYRMAPVGLGLMNRGLRFVHVNEMLAAINGKTVAEHIGQTIFEVIPEVAAIVEPMYRHVLDTGEALLNFEVRGDAPGRPHHNRDYLVSYYPYDLVDGKPGGVTTVVQDVTRLKQAQEALRVANESLEERVHERTAELTKVNADLVRKDVEQRLAEGRIKTLMTELRHVCRLSTMGELASGIAHELNQPLSAIANYANGCKHRLDSGSMDANELSALTEKIATEAVRAGKIIHGVRALVENQPPQLRAIDINATVRDVVELCAAKLTGEGIETKLLLDSDVSTIQGDPVTLTQALLNLVMNAAEAMEAARERVLTIATRAIGGSVLIEIDDTGPGISADVTSSLFDQFVTTKVGGLGLGLGIVRSIIEAHGGTVSLASSSEGARFEVVLGAGGATMGEGDTG